MVVGGFGIRQGLMESSTKQRMSMRSVGPQLIARSKGPTL
jgi:hypothetical protein